MSNNLQSNDSLKVDKDKLEKARIDLLKKQECHEIVLRIREFGVTDAQLLEIINLLALEFENREHMKTIRDAVKTIKKDDLIIAKIDGD